MPTARYSSLWDRLNGDDSTYTEAEWNAWGLANYPTVFEVVNGSNTYPFEAAYNWQINCATIMNTIYLWISPDGGITAQQGRDAFSLSDHEALQVDDIRAWIEAPNQAVGDLDRFNVVKAYTYLVEQRHPLVTKSFFYTKFGIRDDVPSG